MHKTFGNMIQSMTGYGKATAELPDKKINVEIKSLNSKAMDLSARIAPAYREKRWKSAMKLHVMLERGKVDFSLWVEKKECADAATPINQVLVEGYYNQIKAISENLHIAVPTDWFQTLLRMPDVMTRTETQELSEGRMGNSVRSSQRGCFTFSRFPKTRGCCSGKKFREKSRISIVCSNR